MAIPFNEIEIGGVYLTKDNAQEVDAYVVVESKGSKGYLNATPVVNCSNLYSFSDNGNKFNFYSLSLSKLDTALEVEFLSLEATFDVNTNAPFSFYKEQFIDKFPQHFI